MALLQITPVNHTAEEEGTVGTYLGVDLLIARSNNTNFKRAFRIYSKPYKREIANQSIRDEVAADIMIKAVADGILIGWDKNTFPNGTEYSVKNARELLKNDPDCFDFVQMFAKDLDNYLDEEAEATVKE